MLTTKAGPDGGWNAGEILDREDGEHLVSSGSAVPHGPVEKVERAVATPQRESEPVVEKTTAPVPEPEKTAVAPSHDRRPHKDKDARRK
ncbi:hypothetical protein JQ600_35545 [Bradyrhizobium sp. AUGA SZCCT0176]|uniref:hypothetical protein n=1 Tax=Bradyrhizobium sp. AUGA SZCCT0176 TaxID=2807664 RepID=UPI001BA7773C|nr:hypothetical protein [Bradyrhizobium sp. AUGA SZCCT0176]MBR1230212.1 hypothetical protein [Bradyrhizobium sp. AUGA SZCCT0176]